MAITVIPLLLAVTPLPVGSAVPFQNPAVLPQQFRQETPEGFGAQVQVETFDPVARAALLAQQMPRQWSGTYQPFSAAPQQTAMLTIASATALGQMVDLRGEMVVGGTTIPVRGNLNAKSDQLDLLLLGDQPEAELRNGGYFLGLQGLTLSGWRQLRYTHPGGQLILSPVVAARPMPARGAVIRGLW